MNEENKQNEAEEANSNVETAENQANQSEETQDSTEQTESNDSSANDDQTNPETQTETEMSTEEGGGDQQKDDQKEDDQQKNDQQKDQMKNANGGAHDDFDWTSDRKNLVVYTEKEREQMLSMYDNTLTTIEDDEIIQGTVVGKSDSDVILNIGFKSDGLVPLSEFRDMPDITVGDVVDVYVEKKEDARGQLILSRKKAKLTKAWDNIVDAHDNDKVVNGTIVSKTKGGLIVDIFGLETFLPGSQIDVKPIIDYDAYVGKKMEFKVVKINEAIKNAVVSHKALIESDLEQQRQDIIAKLEKGQVLEGTIKNLTDFGAFIDLGGVDGLLYITDISWGRINHPNEVLELNQKLNVVVLDFDDEKRRISLGLKQLEPHPWDVLPEGLTEGSTVKGKIVNIEDYGAFLEITPGVEGLIHVSEVSWSNQPINAKEFFSLGDEYEAKVVTVDREERKMSLSLKQLSQDPWDNIEEKYPIGSKHSGEVKNITPYGVFVELDEYIGGMVHISDLSWIKRFNHPSEFIKVGENLEVVVLEIDKENRKISLGHKQIEEDPWDTFETVFPIGSVHEATVVKRDDKGAIIQLPYGLEGFVPMKHLKKEDNTTAEVDETLDFKILEFDRDDKRIIASHARIHSDKQAEATVAERKEEVKQAKQTKQTINKMNKGQDRSTLGDLEALSNLRDQMEEQEKEPKKKKSEEPKSKETKFKETKSEDKKSKDTESEETKSEENEGEEK